MELTLRYDIKSNSHKYVNDTKEDYIGLMEYFGDVRLPDFEVIVQNLLRKSPPQPHGTRMKNFCIDKDLSLGK